MRSYTYYGEDAVRAPAGVGVVRSYEYSHTQHAAINICRFTRNPGNRMCVTDMSIFITSLDLAYQDWAIIAASAEVCVPFIDKGVAALAMRIPGSMKSNGNMHNFVLSKISKYSLPKKVACRLKASYTLPIPLWLRGQSYGMVDTYLLSDRGLTRLDMFQLTYLKRLLESGRSGSDNNARRIWQLIIIEQWLGSPATKGSA